MSTTRLPPTMRAAQYHAADNQVHVNTVPVPTPGPDDLLVRTVCCSLCCSGCQTHPMWCTAFAGGCRNPGHSADGYFQEFVAVHHRNALVLPPGLDPAAAAPLFCAGVTSYHGIADLPFAAADRPTTWLAVVGHTQAPLTFSTLDIALGRYRIQGASNGTAAQLRACIAFSHARAHTTYYHSLDDIHTMLDRMARGQVQGRLALRFDGV